jgi:hypothetical protein
MATKKSDAEKKVVPEETKAVAVDNSLEAELEALRAEVEAAKAEKAKLEAELAQAQEVKVDVEVVDAKPEEEKVMVMIPFIPGQDPEETVIINGFITKIKKGEPVEVSRPVASVLENSYEAQRIAMINRAKLKNQRTDL